MIPRPRRDHAPTSGEFWHDCAEGGGGGAVVADRTEAGPWETWIVHTYDDGRVSLQASSGHFLCAEPDGTVICNRAESGEYERFTIEVRDVGVAFLSFHGTYLQAPEGGGGAVTASGRCLARIRDRAGRVGILRLDAWTSGRRRRSTKPELPGRRADARPARHLRRDRPADRHGLPLHGRLLARTATARRSARSTSGRSSRSSPSATASSATSTSSATGTAAAPATPTSGSPGTGARSRRSRSSPTAARSFPPTPDYWDRKREYVTLLHELGLKIFDDRGDMNTWTQQREDRSHVPQRAVLRRPAVRPRGPRRRLRRSTKPGRTAATIATC